MGVRILDSMFQLTGGRSKSYRAELDGIRALAVSAAVVFHISSSVIPGGFIAVDTFYVLSGFLITKIISTEISAGSFSFRAFYERRVLRLFPALLVVLAGSVFIAWLIYPPNEFVAFGKHMAFSSVYASNIGFFLEHGYFNLASEKKPLLHLWSMGIEEQFYLVWPVLLYGLRNNPLRRTQALIILTILSFLINLTRVQFHTEEVFYLLHGRFWQMGCGGLLALNEGKIKHVSNRAAILLAYLGICLIISAFFLFNTRLIYPGGWGLFPVFGTVLLIAFIPSSGKLMLIFGNKLMQILGRISYPLYLWHWPLIVFYTFLAYRASLNALYVITVITIVLAMLTHIFIELPLMRLSQTCSKLTVMLLFALLSVGSLGLLVYLKVMPPYNNDPFFSMIAEAQNDWYFPGKGAEKYNQNGIQYYAYGLGAQKVVFLGDSHMQMHMPLIEKVIDQDGKWEALLYTRGGCPSLPNVSDERQRIDLCPSIYKAGIERALLSDVRKVVVNSSWFSAFAKGVVHLYKHETGNFGIDPLSSGFNLVLEEFQKDLKRLKQAGKEVYVIGAHPIGPALDPSTMIERNLEYPFLRIWKDDFNEKDFLTARMVYHERLKAAVQMEGAIFIDPFPYICNPNCLSISDEGVPAYKDETHIRPFYIIERAGYLVEIMK